MGTDLTEVLSLTEVLTEVTSLTELTELWHNRLLGGRLSSETFFPLVACCCSSTLLAMRNGLAKLFYAPTT